MGPVCQAGRAPGTRQEFKRCYSEPGVRIGVREREEPGRQSVSGRWVWSSRRVYVTPDALALLPTVHAHTGASLLLGSDYLWSKQLCVGFHRPDPGSRPSSPLPVTPTDRFLLHNPMLVTCRRSSARAGAHPASLPNPRSVMSH